METLVAQSNPAKVQDNFICDTFPQALDYAIRLTQVAKIFRSRVWHDRFKRYRPNTIEGRLLGWSKKATADCLRLAPGGKWAVHATAVNDGYQLSVWYSRYLPYAYAMMNAENGYKAFGLDFDSVNGFFSTCMGYNWIGYGHNEVMNQEDTNLYDRLYTTSCKLMPPSLPFDEVYRPALCFVAVRQPDLLRKHLRYDAADWRAKHVSAVLFKEGLSLDSRIAT